jgi:hypothetical protein
MLRRAVRWRGTTIAFSGKSGNERRSFTDIVQVKANAIGQVVLNFVDGTSLRIDPSLAHLLQEGRTIPGDKVQPD